MLHFTGMVVCFYLGFFILGGLRHDLWWGVPLLCGLLLSIWMALEQHYGGLEETRKQFMAQPGWRMYSESFLKKIQSDRVFGSFVYPNALAGGILLLLPAALYWTWHSSARLTEITRAVIVGIVAYAALAVMYWSGSKGGWLIAMGAIAVAAAHVNFSTRIKVVALTLFLLAGAAGFFVKYRSYLEKGAASASARLDYWKAAVRITREHPVFGTGPGTFSVPYAAIKSPETEMARLVHNDYLEQATDTGMLGFILYIGMVFGIILFLYRNSFATFGFLEQFLLLGLAAWFVQGFIEFGLYIPGLAWVVFAILGFLLRRCILTPLTIK